MNGGCPRPSQNTLYVRRQRRVPSLPHLRHPKGTVQHGFTITELLVVIAVIAILAALLMPTVQGMVDRARAAQCAANLRQFGAAALLYRYEHNGYLPPGYLLPPIYTDENNNPKDGGMDGKGGKVATALTEGGYLTKNDLPCCPSMRMSEKGVKNLKPGQTARGIFKMEGSYVLNIFLTQTKIEALPGPYWNDNDGPYPGDSKMLLAAEAYFTGISNSIEHQEMTLNGVDLGTAYNHVPRHHGKNRLNFMFLDGHIALLGPRPEKKENGRYDYQDVFHQGGRDGKYIHQRSARTPTRPE